jgi:ubiquinone/menaquinone biosynthesis C-methylase UbiE
VARSALILGQGTGRFLGEFLKLNQKAKVTCIDSSASMIEITRSRLQRKNLTNSRVQFIQADVLELASGSWSEGPFDLVVTHFFLDCFRKDQLELLLPRIAEQTLPEASWLIADFRLPERGLGRVRAQLILRLAYAFFRLTTRLHASRLTAPDWLLQRLGFHLAERQIYNHGLLHSDLWSRI